MSKSPLVPLALAFPLCRMSRSEMVVWLIQLKAEGAMFWRKIVGLLILFICLPIYAAGEYAPVLYKPPPIPLEVQMDDGTKFRAIRAYGPNIEVEVWKNGRLKRTNKLYKLFFQIDSRVMGNGMLHTTIYKFNTDRVDAFWPLQIGNAVTAQLEYWRDGHLGAEGFMTAKVVAKERLSIPAGLFETYVIEKQFNIIDIKSGEKSKLIIKQWFVSDFSFFVKYTKRLLHLNTVLRSEEMVASFLFF